MNVQAFTVSRPHAQIKILTYGVKYNNVKPDADHYFDCRCLDNPPTTIWSFNGMSKPIQSDVMQQISHDKKLYKWFKGVLETALGWAQYATQKSSSATLAFYCHGGRHRSVATAELVNRYLTNKGFVTNVDHLDVLNANAYLKGHRK